jgi:microcompartment protein CcmL/EutN
LSDGPDPALAVVEFDSIAVGVQAGDAMIKASPLGALYAGTVVDSIFLPYVHEAVVAAMASSEHKAALDAEAVGVVETDSVATAIEAADVGVKAARVDLTALRLADGLGGKGYAVFCGVVAEVEAAVDAAVDRVEPTGHLLRRVVIAQMHDEMRANLDADLRFNQRIVLRSGARGS